MTEDEWLTSTHGQPMLDFVQTARTPLRTRWLGWMPARRFAVSERKIRLVETACCDRIAELLPSAQLRSLIDVCRRQVEDEEGAKDTRTLGRDAAYLIQHVLDTEGATTTSWSASFLALAAVGGLFTRNHEPGNSVLEVAARARAQSIADSDPASVHARRLHQALTAEYAVQADLVRDVIGNPFRREWIDLAWLKTNDCAVERIAEAIAQGHSFADLPVLADALEDARCTNRLILDHCRGSGPHVRGCWVVDLVRAKE